MCACAGWPSLGSLVLTLRVSLSTSSCPSKQAVRKGFERVHVVLLKSSQHSRLCTRSRWSEAEAAHSGCAPLMVSLTEVLSHPPQAGAATGYLDHI